MKKIIINLLAIYKPNPSEGMCLNPQVTDEHSKSQKTKDTSMDMRFFVCLPLVLKVILFALLGFGSHVNAEVISSEPHGFEISIERTVKVNSAIAYAQFLKIDQWWSAEHTWFGDSGNLSIVAEVGGCFCEKSSTKEALHMTVSYVDPGREIRMTGGLGPLQMLGIHGAMSWKFIAINENESTIIQYYHVVGFIKGGLQSLAAIVDKVQTIQLDALVAMLGDK